MMKNAVGLSQQLNVRPYNNYQSQQTQTAKAAMPTQGPAGQAQGGNVLDSMGFASELRSQKTVSALMHLNNSFPPTLAERGASVDKDGNISIPTGANNTAPAQKNSNINHSYITPSAPPTQNMQSIQNIQGQATGQPGQVIRQPTAQVPEDTFGIPMNGRSKHSAVNPSNAINLNGTRVFALDNRSLGVLNRLAEKKQNPSAEVKTQSLVDQESQANNSAKKQTEAISTGRTTENSSQIGKLAAQYESASKGSTIIGYDRNGGTSYGTYQISSKAGTFDEFLGFLDKKAPDWAQKLRGAGEANTGSRSGAVPNEWKKLCAEDPEKMTKLEHDFIMESHYKPVASYVEEKWKGNISSALREVIFSTAVQHGVRGAKQVFSQALADTTNINRSTLSSNVNGKENQKEEKAISLLMGSMSQDSKNVAKDNHKNGLQAQEELIKNVYSHRSTKFGSSTLQVQEAAINRFVHEQKEVLSILT